MTVLLTLGAGVLVGVLANLGFGPITIMAVTRRLRHGVRAGMEVGLVTSVLDGVACFLATQAAGFMTAILDKHSGSMKVVGSLILFSVAVGLIRHSRSLNEEVVRDRAERGHPSALVATILLFLSSPVIPAFWLTIAGLVLTYGVIDRGMTSALFFAAGCSLGGVLRYVILLKILLRSVERMKLRLLRKTILALSVLLIGIAAYGLLDAFVIAPAGKGSKPLGEPKEIKARLEEVEIGLQDLGVERGEISEPGSIDVGFALGVIGVAYDPGVPEVCQGSGFPEGVVEVTDLVDEAELEGLPGRVHPAVGGLPQLLP